MKKKRNLLLVLICILTILLIYANFCHSIFFKTGKFFYDKQNYNLAIKYFSRALIYKHDNKNYRYYYVDSLCKVKPTYDIQKKVFLIANSDLDDSARYIAQEKVNEWKSIILEKAGNNYIAQAPSDINIIRWNKKSFPLKIYISLSPTAPYYYTSSINRAIKQWTTSLKFTKFEITDYENSAQIIIKAEGKAQNVCSGNVCKYVSAFTVPTISGNKLKQMIITFYNTDANGNYISENKLYNTILHEMGHALGIMGHSYSSSDLMTKTAESENMYSIFRDDFQYLSGNDINTMKLLYQMEPDITDKHDNNDYSIYSPIILGTDKNVLQKKLKEALYYIKESPEIETGYIDLATIYIQLKEYNKALNNLQKALNLAQSNESKYVIYHNFAVCYMDMGNDKRALDYAILAKNIKPTNEIMEIISLLEK